MHPLVVASLLEVPSAEDTATDGSMARLFYSRPSGAGHCGKRGLLGPLPVTPRGNTYMLFFTDRFSRRTDMFVVTAAKFTAKGTANILGNRYIPLWGCPRSILSDNGLQFFFKLSHVVYKLLVVRKIATSSHHPSGNSGAERVNHTMAQMLAMFVNERQDDWDAQLPHVEFAYDNSISTATTWPPTRFTWAGSRTSLSLFSTAPGSPAVRAWPKTTSHTATWRQNSKSAPTTLFARCMP